MPKNVLLAAVCAGLAISGQTAGKAARDAIFLDQFHVTRLPALLVASAILSIAAALLMTRAMTRFAPGRLMPAANFASAGFLLVEYWLLGRLPGPAAIAVYIHQAVVGALLVSGFYSVVNECFDPRTARRAMGTVGVGATLGGLVGAGLAERSAALFGTSAVLVVLAAVQVVSGLLVTFLVARSPVLPVVRDEAPLHIADTVRNLGRVPLLRQLTCLVVFGAVAAAFIDYVFKARASAAYDGPDLLRFFAAYYGGVGALTAFIQWTLGKTSLESWGLGRSVGSLPATVAVTGAAALLVPGIESITLARGSENVLRNSLYRQAYEVLYTPLPARERRSTKTVVDVGVERLGDALGGTLVAIILVAGVATAATLVAGAVVLGCAGAWVATRVQHSYVQALERGLVDRAVALDLDEVRDRTSRETLLQSLQRVGTSLPGSARRGRAASASSAPARVSSSGYDPILQRSVELRSGDAARVRAALDGPQLEATHVALAIPLLAWNDVAAATALALEKVAGRVTGQLVDALVDADEEFTVRRRLPRVLAAAPGPRAVQGLLLGLRDGRFEVRFRSARALARLHSGHPELAIDGESVYASVLRELAVDEPTFRNPAILDEDSGDSVLADEVLRDRVSRGLEHVFTLLTLVLPAEPIRIAFRALHTNDPSLRGTAVEYLEQVLPPLVREKLWPRIEPETARHPAPRPRAQVESALMESRADISRSLQAVRDVDV